MGYNKKEIRSDEMETSFLRVETSRVIEQESGPENKEHADFKLSVRKVHSLDSRLSKKIVHFIEIFAVASTRPQRAV